MGPLGSAAIWRDAAGSIVKLSMCVLPESVEYWLPSVSSYSAAVVIYTWLIWSCSWFPDNYKCANVLSLTVKINLYWIIPVIAHLSQKKRKKKERGKNMHRLYLLEWHTCFKILMYISLLMLKTWVFLWCIKLLFQWICRFLRHIVVTFVLHCLTGNTRLYLLSKKMTPVKLVSYFLNSGL